MIKKQGISLLLSAVLVFSLCGCGQKTVETTGTTIELIEPVNVTTNVEKVSRRTIYDSEKYAAGVYPTVTEYSFTKDMGIEDIGAYWGESVEKSDTLVYGDTEKMDEQIEAMQEKIADMDTSMTEALQDLNDTLAAPKEELKRMKGIVDAYASAKPAEKVPQSSIDPNGSDEMVTNPEYTKWYKESEMWTGKYKVLEHNIKIQEDGYNQRKALYDLERAYLNDKLALMKKERKNCTLTARENGDVVAMKTADDNGNWNAQKDQAVVALGNMDEKVIKSEFINKRKATLAKEMYALINGVRYEVEYHPIDNDEYTKLSESGVTVYTEFTFLSDCSDVKIGDFVTICVLYQKEENALSVPVEAIHKDSGIQFVYVMKDGQSVRTTVTTGFSDGVYTVINSGLSEGDEVLVENAREIGKKTAEVTYGTFNGNFKERGRLASAMEHTVTNPIEYGTTYFGEYKVDFLQHVEKGDVIATVRVAADELAIQRKEVQLQRARERLEDLRAAGEEDNKKAIEARLEEIAELQKQLKEMQEDAKTTEIKADRSGMISGMMEYEPETILNKDSYLVAILDESSVYVSVEDPNHVLYYGNEVQISYSTYMGKDKKHAGRVASIGDAGLSKELQNDRIMIMVPKEELSDLVMARADNRWDPQPYTVEAKIRDMDHVLVVPRNAVTDIDGNTYVDVMDEQGNVKACSFVAGGYDDSNYWIIEGLSEGMVVCLK